MCACMCACVRACVRACCREARLTQAVAFLKQPKIANAPRGTKIKYLQEKCFLTADELHEALVTAYPLPNGAG